MGIHHMSDIPIRVTRREWIGAASAAALDAQTKDSERRPNLLYIMTDQQCADAFSAAGCRDLRTPAIDSIASRGVRFTEAYCSNPLCVPARTSMLTGLMPHENGVTYNDMKLSVSANTFMGKILSDAGYDCGYFGKWHVPVPVTDKDRHGFSTIAHTAANGVDSLIPDASIEFLRRQRTKPFLLVSSFVNPHDICEWARGTKGKDGEYVEAPTPAQCPELPANFAIPDHEPEVIREVQARDKSAYPTRGLSEGQWRQYRFAYYRLIERVDAHIERILDVLRETGQDRNTVIIFASDHGDGNAAHRWNQKQVLYEEPARVPFLVAAPGSPVAGSVNSRHLVASCLDLIPTMCDYAGVSVPPSLKGRSLRALAGGRALKTWREDLVAQTEFCTFNKSFGIHGRLLRTGSWKYVVYSEGKIREQLFDMRNDRGEMNNLAVSERHQKQLNDCRNKLAAWCQTTGDRFTLPST